jgi:DNA-directed RNA polymerase specialized sigma24 family protein
MTKQQLQRHRKWLMQKYGIDGEEIFQQTCLIAIKRYQTIEKTNQNLFGLLCREAARMLLYHEKHEIPFSYLRCENEDQTDEVEFEPEDPEWRKNFDIVESREEVEKMHGKWLLDALLKAVEPEPKPSKVTTDCIDMQMELFA